MAYVIHYTLLFLGDNDKEKEFKSLRVKRLLIDNGNPGNLHYETIKRGVFVLKLINK